MLIVALETMETPTSSTNVRGAPPAAVRDMRFANAACLECGRRLGGTLGIIGLRGTLQESKLSGVLLVAPHRGSAIHDGFVPAVL